MTIEKTKYASEEFKNSTNNFESAKNEYIKNQNTFDKKQYNMDIDQIVLNNIILKLEEDVYFGHREKKEDDCEVSMFEKEEQNFMQMFTCCRMGFRSYNEFCVHKEYVHSEFVSDEEELQDFIKAGTKVDKNEFLYIDEEKYIQSCVDKIELDNKIPAIEININREFTAAEELKLFKCTEYGCETSFKSKNLLKSHIDKIHGSKGDEKPYKCSFPTCTKKYKNSNGLKYHMAHNNHQ